MKLVRSLLVKYGCRRDALDIMGGLASTCAAFYGHTHLLQMLIDEFNFSPTAVRLRERSNLLHQACAGKHYETANILISKCNLDPLSKMIDGCSALHYLCYDIFENIGNFHAPADVEITTFVDHLISLKCDPMDKDNGGQNALHCAASWGRTEVVIQLVRKYKCLVESRDSNDNTPLHYAARKGHVHVVQALLSDLAADVEARNKQNSTALHVAASNGHSNVVTILVDQFGCSPHTKGFNNRTSLRQACACGHLELVEKLINDYHCDPMARDNEGATPLHIAALMGKEHVVRRLVSNYDKSPHYKFLSCHSSNMKWSESFVISGHGITVVVINQFLYQLQVATTTGLMERSSVVEAFFVGTTSKLIYKKSHYITVIIQCCYMQCCIIMFVMCLNICCQIR